MKTLTQRLVVLCVAACSLAVQAETLKVTTTARFELPPLTAGPSTLSLGFSLTEPLTGVTPELDTSFRLENITIDGVFNSSAVTSTSNTVGWFSNPAFGYYGIDVRLKDLLVPGDLLQMIFVTPVVLFSGTTAMPTLDRLNLSGLSGGIYHYATGSGAATAEGSMSQATYGVSAVPEPAAAWLLPLGLVLIAAARRRSLRAVPDTRANKPH